MAISLVKNKRDEAFIIFKRCDDAIVCNSKEIKNQILFILSSLEKYKQINFLNSVDVPEEVGKINKHYKISQESISIQKSFLKFFKEKLEHIQEPSLNYQSIITLLS